jgi:hypothetical protein
MSVIRFFFFYCCKLPDRNPGWLPRSPARENTAASAGSWFPRTCRAGPPPCQARPSAASRMPAWLRPSHHALDSRRRAGRVGRHRPARARRSRPRTLTPRGDLARNRSHSARTATIAVDHRSQLPLVGDNKLGQSSAQPASGRRPLVQFGCLARRERPSPVLCHITCHD